MSDRIYTNKDATAIITPPAIPLHVTDIEWVRSDIVQEMVAGARAEALRDAGLVVESHLWDKPTDEYERGRNRALQSAAAAILALIEKGEA